MKSIFALLGLVLFGQVASAQNVFTYRPVLVEQSNTGRMCPELAVTSAVSGHAVHMTDVRGISAVYVFEKTTRSCKEGVRCDSENHYTKAGSTINVSLKLNNNGEYPTTDLPGYSSLKLSWKDQETSKAKHCTYMLL